MNVSIDEDYLDENGKIDVDKMEIIAFDMVNNTYRVLGKMLVKLSKMVLIYKNSASFDALFVVVIVAFW